MIHHKVFHRLSLSLCFFLCHACLAGSPCLASDNLAKAMQLYKNGQYMESLGYIEAELKTNPKNAAAHYLFGNVLVNRKAFPEAIREYESAAALDPSGPSGIYSKQELARLGARSKPPLEAAPETSRKPSLPTANQGQEPGDKESRALKQAVSSTSRQTTEESKAIEEECDRKVAEIEKVLEDKVKALEEEMKARIAENGVYQVLVGGRAGRQSYYDPEPLNEPIREDYKGRIKVAQDEADRHREEVKASYKKRIELIEQAGMTVDKGFLGADQAMDIKLRPKGSDLHVHNYESSDQASGHTVPLVAEPGKLAPVAKKGKTSIIRPAGGAQKTGQ